MNHKIKRLRKYLYFILIMWLVVVFSLHLFLIRSAKRATDKNEVVTLELVTQSVLAINRVPEQKKQVEKMYKQMPIIVKLLQEDLLLSYQKMVALEKVDNISVKLLLWAGSLPDPTKSFSKLLSNDELNLLDLVQTSMSSAVKYHYKNEHSGQVYLALHLPRTEQCPVCKPYSDMYSVPLNRLIISSLDFHSFHLATQKHNNMMMTYFLFFWFLGTLIIILGYFGVRKTIESKLRAHQESVFNLVDVLEQRDTYTAGHTARVAEFSLHIAKEMELTDAEHELLHRAAMLHDIGKISTPDAVLLKPGELNKRECEVMQQHVVSSYEILKNVDIFKDIAYIVRCHHERFDGFGYPDGLIGEQIPLLSKILTVADSFDAMITNRIYKSRMTVEQALNELKRCSEHQFSPEIIHFAEKAFLNVIVSVEASQLPTTLLEHQRFAIFYNDTITQAFNKNYLLLLLAQTQWIAKYRYLLLIKIGNFNSINKLFGWQKGDDKLAEIAKSFLKINKEQLVFRVFGDDFVLLLQDKIKMPLLNKVMDMNIENTPLTWTKKYIDLHKNIIKSIDDIDDIDQFS